MDDEEVPVRSPIDIKQAEVASDQDEDDFSTLIFIQKEFNREMKKLKEVDALNLKESDGLSIKEQIAANKKALEILEPLQQTVNSTIDDIKLKQKGEK